MKTTQPNVIVTAGIHVRFLLRTILATLLLTVGMYDASGQDQPAPYAGIVNSDTIWLQSYSFEIGRRVEYLGGNSNYQPAEVLQNAWLDMVRQTVITQSARERGIVVTSKDVDSILLNATPDYVKRGIVDGQGRFDLPTLRAMMFNPDSVIRSRAPNMTPTEFAEQSAELKKSMAGLREQILTNTTTMLLKNYLRSSFILDTARLHDQFEIDATNCLADVVHIPCFAKVGAPLPADVERYHGVNQYAYTTTVPMRRIAVLSWPMTAAQIDSSLLLNNIGEFISLINKNKNQRVRDSIWLSVASTTASGIARLYSDTVEHREFYNAVKGKKVGTAVGPIMAPTGAHVLLIDSIITAGKPPKKQYDVRIIASPIEPSRETIDSILREVTAAQEMYDQGTPLGEVATKFNRTIELSKFFTESEQLFGSFRQVHAAFTTQLAAGCPPVETPEKGVVLAIVIDSIPAGSLPLEAVHDRVIADLHHQMSCNETGNYAKSVKGLISRLPEGTLIVADKINKAQILRSVSVEVSGQIGGVIFDTIAAKVATSAQGPGLIGPFLGTSGWFYINVLSVTHPTESEFEMYVQLKEKEAFEAQFEEHWKRFQDRQLASAIITDNRWLYFRY